MKYAACFIIANNKILILKRSSNELEGDKYGLVGGKIEEGEEPLAAMKREIYEETKFVINPEELIDLGNYTLPFSGKEFEFQCYKLMFQDEFIPKLDPNESISFEWVTFEELQKKELVSGLQTLIKILTKDSLI